MSYAHRNSGPVMLTMDPIDADSTDWVFFSYQGWLRADETITSHSASIVGGTLVSASAYIGSMTDADGATYEHVYGFQVKPTIGAPHMLVTHRVSTSTSGSTNLGRTNIDHSAIIPVRLV